MVGSAGSAVAVEVPPRRSSTNDRIGRWGVCQTYSNQEQYAVKNLENQGYQAFCPLEGRPKKGAPLTSVLTPLFPCYAFVLIEPDRQWRSIDSTYGVIRLLTDRNRDNPRPLFTDDVDARVSAALAKLRASVADPFPPGTMVRVRHRSHVLYSFEGTVERMDKNMRVMVMMCMFGRDMEVTFDDPSALEVVTE